MPFERLVIDQNRPFSESKPWDQWAYDYANTANDCCVSLGDHDPIAKAAHRKLFERTVRSDDPDAPDDLIQEMWAELMAHHDAEAEETLLRELEPDHCPRCSLCWTPREGKPGWYACWCCQTSLCCPECFEDTDPELKLWVASP